MVVVLQSPDTQQIVTMDNTALSAKVQMLF